MLLQCAVAWNGPRDCSACCVCVCANVMMVLVLTLRVSVLSACVMSMVVLTVMSYVTRVGIHMLVVSALVVFMLVLVLVGRTFVLVVCAGDDGIFVSVCYVGCAVVVADIGGAVIVLVYW